MDDFNKGTEEQRFQSVSGLQPLRYWARICIFIYLCSP